MPDKTVTRTDVVTFIFWRCHVIHTENDPQAHFLEKGIYMFFSLKERGQGLVEYAIILSLVALIVIAVVRLLGPKLGDTFSTIASSMP